MSCKVCSSVLPRPQLTSIGPLDARWFTKEEIKAVLNHPTSINSHKRQTAIDIASQQGAATGPADPPFLLPWNTSIAGQLISAWAFESE